MAKQKMHINNLPVEILEQIFRSIPLKDASNIMRVNKQWYQEYRAVIYRQKDAKFEEILYSSWDDWFLSPDLIPDYNWSNFLISKLRNFCDNFDIFYLGPKLQDIYKSLKQESEKIYKEKDEIDKLLAIYEASYDFEGWFPDWLWEGMHKNNRQKSAINYGNMNRVRKFIVMLSEWTIENFVQSLELP
jgi:hypothetical protein